MKDKDHDHADLEIYDAFSSNTSFSNYQTIHRQSVADPASFWSDQASKYITFFQNPSPNTPVIHGGFHNGDVTFFAGSKLNVCYNAIDRHVYKNNGEGANEIAMIWEGDEPTDTKSFTYGELLNKVSKIANALKSQGVTKGDRVTIYMPMIPEVSLCFLFLFLFLFVMYCNLIL